LKYNDDDDGLSSAKEKIKKQNKTRKTGKA
jgi:hypothetical protein